ncbi:glycoside hydrolase family 3 C-terminal domain-containing protein [Anaerocaecibacter muris]|uniref:glycoside hydrolase family 3 C-terminal domain-containing protein n=1 Tax=Anaerocaecibacter muris TaxID=2941513 RepID=UPI003F69353E
MTAYNEVAVAQERAILELRRSIRYGRRAVRGLGDRRRRVGGQGKAIVYVGFCGERGIDALCDVLCGNINPSGKLSETLPSGSRHSVADGYIDCSDYALCEGLDVDTDITTPSQNIAFPFGTGCRIRVSNIRA